MTQPRHEPRGPGPNPGRGLTQRLTYRRFPLYCECKCLSEPFKQLDLVVPAGSPLPGGHLHRRAASFRICHAVQIERETRRILPSVGPDSSRGYPRIPSSPPRKLCRKFAQVASESSRVRARNRSCVPSGSCSRTSRRPSHMECSPSDIPPTIQAGTQGNIPSIKPPTPRLESGEWRDVFHSRVAYPVRFVGQQVPTLWSYRGTNSRPRHAIVTRRQK